jgi:hypothetical protein
MKEYIGHHTCSNQGGEEYVLANAPFLSKYEVGGEKNPFLGSGYYFWDYDIPQAKRWGKLRYKSGYFVLEATINTTNDNFLDLAGDRQDMGYFLLVARKLVQNKIIEKDWKIGELIEFLKRLHAKNPESFPYKIIRAQDCTVLERNDKVYFREGNSYTYLNPRYIFCLIEVNDVALSNKKIIFQFPK